MLETTRAKLTQIANPYIESGNTEKALFESADLALEAIKEEDVVESHLVLVDLYPIRFLNNLKLYEVQNDLIVPVRYKQSMQKIMLSTEWDELKELVTHGSN